MTSAADLAVTDLRVALRLLDQLDAHQLSLISTGNTRRQGQPGESHAVHDRQRQLLLDDIVTAARALIDGEG